MTTHPCSWSVLRVVPHPHTGVGQPVGVVVHSRPAEYLGVRLLSEIEALTARAPGVDLELLSRYLHTYQGVVEGKAEAGPIALLSPPERFYWLAAPRSDVLQPSVVEHGVAANPAALLQQLFQERVLQGESGNADP